MSAASQAGRGKEGKSREKEPRMHMQRGGPGWGPGGLCGRDNGYCSSSVGKGNSAGFAAEKQLTPICSFVTIAPRQAGDPLKPNSNARRLALVDS